VQLAGSEIPAAEHSRITGVAARIASRFDAGKYLKSNTLQGKDHVPTDYSLAREVAGSLKQAFRGRGAKPSPPQKSPKPRAERRCCPSRIGRFVGWRLVFVEMLVIRKGVSGEAGIVLQRYVGDAIQHLYHGRIRAGFPPRMGFAKRILFTSRITLLRLRYSFANCQREVPGHRCHRPEMLNPPQHA